MKEKKKKIDEKERESMSDLLEQLLNRMKEEVASTVRQTMISVLQDEKGQDYPERVSVTQASEITGYSKNSLYQMHSQGKVPGAHKVGSKLMFDTATLRKWVAEGGRPL